MTALASQPTQIPNQFESTHEIEGNRASISVGERIDPSTRHQGWDTAVYEASFDTDTASSESKLALKVIENPTDARMAEFIIEEELLSVLPEHRNIVRMLDSGVIVSEDGKELPYMVKERADMGTLSNHMHDLSDEQYIQIERDVANGLAFLEEYHISDGDVTPSNIGLFTDDEGNITGKIIDLGSARPIDNDTAQFSVEHSADFDQAVEFLVSKNHSPGNQEYASPETIQGDIRPTTAKDIWALGRIALVVGSERTSDDIGRVRIDDEDGDVNFVVDPEYTAIPYRPKVVSDFIKKCLILDPDKRLSARQAADQLDSQDRIFATF